LPETQPRELRVPFDLRHLSHTYRAMAADRCFVLLSLVTSLNFGAVFLYVSSAPTIVLNLLHLNERQFAWLFIPTIGGMTIGAGLSGRLAGRFDAVRTVRLGYLLIFGGIVLNLGLNSWFPPALPWFVVPVAVGGMGVSLAFPTLTLLMLDRFPATRGAAASVQAAMSLAGSAAVGGLLSPVVSSSGLSLACAGTLLSVSGYCCWGLYCRIAERERGG
jgi:DHA1 family bicyclomycin/chloramphenicol resistance-like MFS transporter